MSGNLYLRPGWYDERRLSSVLHRPWRTTAFWIASGSLVIWLLFYRYFATASARDPTSYFFDTQKGYQRKYSLEREKQGYNHIESLNATGASPTSSIQPGMCIGIATIARPSSEQYVRGTIGSLLEGLSEEQRASIHLITFIAHTDPDAHPIYHEPWLKAVSNKILTYDTAGKDMPQLRMYEEEHHPRNKSMYDYGYLLNSCLETGAKWVTIVEDDVVARAGWFGLAMSSLQTIQTKMQSNPWLYMRIFYTEGLLGWNSEEWPTYAGVSLTIFLLSIAGIVSLQARSPLLRRNLSNFDIGLICCGCLPAFIILYFMAGRMTMRPLTPGVRLMPRFGCCSQGFIFPREIVPKVIERTKQAMYEDYYIDMLFERYAEKEHLPRFAIFPSLLQHVGSKSSKGWGYDEHAGEIFNFAFESYS